MTEGDPPPRNPKDIAFRQHPIFEQPDPFGTKTESETEAARPRIFQEVMQRIQAGFRKETNLGEGVVVGED